MRWTGVLKSIFTSGCPFVRTSVNANVIRQTLKEHEMINRNLSLLLAAVMCSTAIAAEAPVDVDLYQVKRVLDVAEKLKFPKLDGIRTWKQNSDSKGVAAVINKNDSMLTDIANFWADCEKQDLENVAIIRGGGRSIRITDLRMIRTGKREDVVVNRGDIVVFLYPEKGE